MEHGIYSKSWFSKKNTWMVLIADRMEKVGPGFLWLRLDTQLSGIFTLLEGAGGVDG